MALASVSIERVACAVGYFYCRIGKMSVNSENKNVGGDRARARARVLLASDCKPFRGAQ